MDVLHEENNLRERKQTVFCSPLSPLGPDDKQESFHRDFTVPRKFHHCSKWRHDQGAVFWIKLEEAQDLGLQFGQTKSHGMIVYQTVPPECIFKAIAKHDKEIIFDRLPEAQPAPKVTLKSHW